MSDFYKDETPGGSVSIVRKNSPRGKAAKVSAERAADRADTSDGTKGTPYASSDDVKEKVAATLGGIQAAGDAKFFKHTEKPLK